MIATGLLSAFAIGLFGSTHCIAMCSGMASLVQIRTARGASLEGPGSAARHLLSSAGRLASYVAAGAIAGALGSLASTVTLARGVLPFFSGALMVLVGLYLTGLLPSYGKFDSVGQPVWRKLKPMVDQVYPARTRFQAFAFGALWGWLPCGLTYAALTFSITSASSAEGALRMACFGMGTLPAMLSVGWLAQRIARYAHRPLIRGALGSVVVLFGAVHLYWASAELQPKPPSTGLTAACPLHSHGLRSTTR